MIPPLAPNLHATSSQVCETINGEVLYAPRSDIALKVWTSTCGTLNDAHTSIVSETQNVTFYCTNGSGSNEIKDCSTDFTMTYWERDFAGTNNTATQYQNNTLMNGNIPRGDMDNCTLCLTTTYSSTVDYVQTYWKINFTDNFPPHGKITRSREQFIGTINAFRIDWADYDNDGSIAITDLANIAHYYGQTCTAPGTPQCYWDFDRNSTVDQTDVNLAGSSTYFGKAYTISHYPGQGCHSYFLDSLNVSANCHPQRYYGWKDLCTTFPDTLDENYCLYSETS